MASLDYDVSHNNANDLAITVPNTVNRNVLSCNSKGDQYAEAMYKSGGHYTKLANSFEKIAQYCKTALGSSGIVSNSIKADIKDAKKKASSQEVGCKSRRDELKQQYNITRDIYTMLNKQ